MRLCKKIASFFIIVIITAFACDNNTSIAQHQVDKLKDEAQDKWVDSIYSSLSEEEKIAQLFMIAAYSGSPKQNDTLIEKLIKEYHIGGLIFMQGTPTAQALQTNHFQQISKVPLLIGMDAEWGLGMRLTGVRNFPRQMLLGASDDSALVYELGKHIAAQCKALGVHFNFAPVVDVNNNPINPVINFRSFGASPQQVAKLGIAYMKGMQDHGVLASAKHFPGHGDVEVDSHVDLPIINKSKSELDKLELYPFKQLIDAGVASIMVAHLSLPQLEPEPKLPSTLSHNIITKLLKEEMKYEGLIITDALNMEGVAKYYPVGEVDLKAFLAGNDILLFSQDVPKAIKAIKLAISDGRITEERLSYSVKKILRTKYKVGLHTISTIDTAGIDNKLNAEVDRYFYKAAKQSITGIELSDSLISLLNNTPAEKIAVYAINGTQNEFNDKLKAAFPGIQIIRSLNNASQYTAILAYVSNLSLYPGKDKEYGLSKSAIQQMKALHKHDNIIKIVLGNPYASKHLCGQRNVVLTYENHEATQNVAVEILKNNHKPTGKLSVNVCL